MGKSISRWISNILLGKKGDKSKRNYACFSVEYPMSQTSVVDHANATSKVKRRWSFGRSTGKPKAHHHVYSKSVDSIDIIHLPIKIQAVVQHAAAIKIQSFFRSYLARKALSALKSLVKLQSLVRGHLVRKQTKATLRRMHALMAIQVRARVHRIQLAEEAHFLKTQSSVSLLHGNGFRKTDGYADYSFITSQNRPRNQQTGRASFSYEKTIYADHHHHQLLDDTILPNYMGNTESSKARVCRSQSEPKRRPNSGHRQKNKPMGSLDGVRVQPRVSCSRSRQVTHENQESWLINLYGTNQYDDSSSINSNSNNGRSLYESDGITSQFERVILSPSWYQEFRG